VIISFSRTLLREVSYEVFLSPILLGFVCIILLFFLSYILSDVLLWVLNMRSLSTPTEIQVYQFVRSKMCSIRLSNFSTNPNTCGASCMVETSLPNSRIWVMVV